LGFYCFNHLYFRFSTVISWMIPEGDGCNSRYNSTSQIAQFLCNAYLIHFPFLHTAPPAVTGAGAGAGEAAGGGAGAGVKVGPGEGMANPRDPPSGQSRMGRAGSSCRMPQISSKVLSDRNKSSSNCLKVGFGCCCIHSRAEGNTKALWDGREEKGLWAGGWELGGEGCGWPLLVDTSGAQPG